MPNFGLLKQDLEGGSLTINGKLVLDSRLNLIAGNIVGGNIFGPLYTSMLVEENATAGITIFGNVHIAPGYFLTGDIAESIVNDNLIVNGDIQTTGNILIGGGFINGPSTAVGPVIRGNTAVIGILTVTGPDLLVPQVHCDTIVSEAVITNTIAPKLNNQIDIFGNVFLLDGSLHTNAIHGLSSGSGPVIHGNVIMTGPNVNIPRVTAGHINTTTINTNTITTGNILGNVFMPGPVISIPTVFCDRIIGNVEVIGNLDVNGALLMCDNLRVLERLDIDGSIFIAKSNAVSDPLNVVSTTRSSGVVNYYNNTTLTTLAEQSITIQNPHIHNDSVVYAVVGSFVGTGLPIITRTVVTEGQVIVWLTNLSGTSVTATNEVPIQYVIL